MKKQQRQERFFKQRMTLTHEKVPLNFSKNEFIGVDPSLLDTVKSLPLHDHNIERQSHTSIQIKDQKQK